MQIGGKTKKARLTSQPQVVVQRASGANEFALIGADEEGITTIRWVGDPNAATKFNSRYEAKVRIRTIADVPETRQFKVLGENVRAAA